MRIRVDKGANYRAVFLDGKTLRMRMDPDMPIGVPASAEIEDVAINSKCFANCSYCYTNATKHGVNFEHVVDKAYMAWWEGKDENDRPFQIAIGGAGEPTIHPDFPRFVQAVRSIGIVPNYTTNGMHLSNEVIDATEELCGGVAVSYHPHIRNVFNEAIHKLKDRTRLNAHVIVGDRGSMFDLQAIYETYKDDLEYLVVLPYQAAGRGVPVDTHETWIETFRWVSGLSEERQSQFAFGALFYPWLLENPVGLNIDIYEPEVYSGYRIMDDTWNVLRRSSYDLRPKFDKQ